MSKLLSGLFSILVALTLSVSAYAGELVINYDGSDPAPQKAFNAVIEAFEKAHPDITVKWNTFDHEGYKTSIRNFLTADAPDVASWYAGNRMAPFVNAGLFEDVSDLWESDGLNKSMASAAPSMTIDGKKWGVPYTYYQWGVYYRQDIFEEQGIEVPTTWAEFLDACAKLKSAGITPITIGTKYLWTAGGWFDYLNLRVNGYDYHMALTSGEASYLDSEVNAVFDRWDELTKEGYFLENHASLSWQEALAPMIQGDAAMYLMGNFAVAPLREGGLTDDQIGFFQFPEITAGIPKSEDAPIDTFHIPSKAKNKEDAKKFLSFLASPETQTTVNSILGQLPINSNATVDESDKFLTAGFDMLTNAHALAQFYDRDAPAEVAKAGMEGFQEYMVNPDRRATILERVDKAREKAKNN